MVRGALLDAIALAVQAQTLISGMAESALAKKLLIKPGCAIRLIDAPEGYGETLSPLPDGAKVITAEPAEVVQAFARSKAELDSRFLVALAALKPGGVFWLLFPEAD
jgi:hypothetical protein